MALLNEDENDPIVDVACDYEHDIDPGYLADDEGEEEMMQHEDA